MTRSVEAKIESIERPFSVTVALLSMAIMGAVYALCISSAVESVAKADAIREHVADLYTEIASLEASYAEAAGAINVDQASLVGFVEPASVSYVSLKSSGLSFVSPSLR